MLAKLSYSVRKTLFYEALTCCCTLEIIINFWKNSICMIFGCGDCFTSLIGRYLAWLREISIWKGKRFTGNCVMIFALFFEKFMPEIHDLLKN